MVSCLFLVASVTELPVVPILDKSQRIVPHHPAVRSTFMAFAEQIQKYLRNTASFVRFLSSSPLLSLSFHPLSCSQAPVPNFIHDVCTHYLNSDGVSPCQKHKLAWKFSSFTLEANPNCCSFQVSARRTLLHLACHAWKVWHRYLMFYWFPLRALQRILNHVIISCFHKSIKSLGSTQRAALLRDRPDSVTSPVASKRVL